jgi:hypothetical protein
MKNIGTKQKEIKSLTFLNLKILTRQYIDIVMGQTKEEINSNDKPISSYEPL